MKPSRSTFSTLTAQSAAAALAGAALFLSACVLSNENTAEVDPAFADAKVDARVAGGTLSGAFAQGLDWSGGAPTGLQALGGLSSGMASLNESAALSKRADAGLELKVDLGDTAKGYATVYAETHLLLVEIRDTAVVKWDDKARDGIKDNENILSFKRVSTALGGRVETTEITDADGDKQITAVPGRDNKARLVVTAAENGSLAKTTLLVGAGPDADFQADADNTVLEASWIKTQGGRTSSVTFENRAGGTEIVRGDTLTVHLKTLVASADDTLKQASIDYVMNPGRDLKSDTDDVGYAIRIATQKRFGLERSASFSFVPDAPVPHGQDPVSGSFSGSATYANGKSASLKGSFSPAGFTAEFTGPEGRTLAVTYSKDGKVLAETP